MYVAKIALHQTKKANQQVHPIINLSKPSSSTLSIEIVEDTTSNVKPCIANKSDSMDNPSSKQRLSNQDSKIAEEHSAPRDRGGHDNTRLPTSSIYHDNKSSSKSVPNSNEGRLFDFEMEEDLLKLSIQWISYLYSKSLFVLKERTKVHS